MNLRIRIRTIIRIRKLSILLIIILVTLPTVIAYRADLTEHDYLSILAEFKYAVESSIARFNDFIALVASFIIIVHNQDYQLAKENDYASLIAEFIYSISDPSIATVVPSTSNMSIVNDMDIQKQESIYTDRYSLLNIQFNANISIEQVQEGDSKWI
jgi:hypothetical protein